MAKQVTVSEIDAAVALHGAQRYERTHCGRRDGISVTGSELQTKRVALELGFDVVRNNGNIEIFDDTGYAGCIATNDVGSALHIARQHVTEHHLPGDF